jgi:hypothetical protein
MTGSDFLHFEHFKVGARDSVITEFEVTMAHIPYAMGYSPHRWQHVVDFELLKKEGIFRPETFQMIQLYEPDFNQNNWLLGREAGDGSCGEAQQSGYRTVWEQEEFVGDTTCGE